MSAFTEHHDDLQHYEQMFGRNRGRLAVSLDRLTNALVLVGQHARPLGSLSHHHPLPCLEV